MLPAWLDNLKRLATVGPVTWFRRRLVEFLLGFIVGVAAGFGQLIQDGLLWVRDAFVSAGGALLESGEFLAGLTRAVGDGVRALGVALGVLGPLEPLGWIVVLVGLMIVVYRLGSALLEAIPVAGGFVKSLLGVG